MSNLPATHVITPECRLSFPVLFEPKPYFDKGEEYQCTLLFPPETDFDPFYAAMRAAMLVKWEKTFKLADNPIKSASEKEFAGYDEGWHFLAMHGTTRPAVVDQLKIPVTDPARCYPGLWVRAHINAYGWNYKNKKGVSFGLNAIQIVREGERLDGRIVTGDVFTPLEVDADTLGPVGAQGTAAADDGVNLDDMFG